MLFTDNSLLVISDDPTFLDVARAMPYEMEIFSDIDALLSSTRYFDTFTVLFDVTTANIDGDAVFNKLANVRTLIFVGTHAAMDLIERYVTLSKGKAVNYVFKPIVSPLLKLTIDSTYGGQELQEFMGFVGMELKNPLTSIQGYSELLVTNNPDEPLRTQAVKSIHRNAQRMMRLIDDFRLTVQIERGRRGFIFDDYPPIIVVQELVGLMKKQFAEKQQTLRTSVANDLPNVWVDSHHIQVVLRNLLENASTFSHPEAQITLAAVQVDDMIQFSVQDNGIGIKEQDKSHIFELFFRSEDARNHYGMGMSLSIARHIVIAHNGRIWFESEYGKGSTFYFTIPIAADKA